MSALRTDCWGQQVTPRDHTWGERPTEVQFCDFCSVAHPANPDVEAVSGLWLCSACVEETLQGAIHA